MARPSEYAPAALALAMVAVIALIAGVLIGRLLPRPLDPCHERAHQVWEAMASFTTPDVEGMVLACVGEYLTDEERAELAALRKARGLR